MLCIALSQCFPIQYVLRQIPSLLVVSLSSDSKRPDLLSNFPYILLIFISLAGKIRANFIETGTVFAIYSQLLDYIKNSFLLSRNFCPIIPNFSVVSCTFSQFLSIHGEIFSISLFSCIIVCGAAFCRPALIILLFHGSGRQNAAPTLEVSLCIRSPLC